MSFVTHTPLPVDAPQPSALDFSGLARLRMGVAQGAQAPAEQQKDVARQFEAMFLQMMLKQARQSSASLAPGLFDSPATRMAQSLGDEQAALNMASPGLGLAQALLAQMRGGSAPAGIAAATPPEAATSRLPGLRSRIGTDHPEIASSISALIDLLGQNRLVERVSGAIRGAPEHIRSFVDKMAAAADYASAQSGVPAKLILSQAALESGWGRREITRPDGSTSHNLFGIKATGGWTGDVVHVMTTEYQDGTARKLSQPFRAYGSYAESFADYARLISHNDRYREVLDAPTAEAAARRVQEAGYATDPAYADKLISIMGYFNVS